MTVLPDAITKASLYTIGINAEGHPEAVVFCSVPYPRCPECGAAHFIMIVDEARGYRCAGCAGKVRA